MLAIATSLENCYKERVAKAGEGAVIGPMDGDFAVELADPKQARMLRNRWVSALMVALDVKAPSRGDRGMGRGVASKCRGGGGRC